MAVIRKSHLQKALYQAVTKTITIKTMLMTDLGLTLWGVVPEMGTRNVLPSHRGSRAWPGHAC